MVRFHLYNMAAINPATIENADPDKCANAPFTPQPGEKRKALKSRDFKASRLVEHRGVEPLTSTMRMSRATNCANAPYGFPEVFRGSFPRFTSAGRVTFPFILKGFP